MNPVKGVVEPGSEVLVEVMLQPITGPNGKETEYGHLDRNRQMFMVKSTVVESNEAKVDVNEIVSVCLLPL